MSDSTALLSILAVTIAAYSSVNWATKTTNDRFDEILSGVVKGVPVPIKQRWLMLINNWLALAVFLIVFLLIIALGLFEIARGSEEQNVKYLGYMSATLALGGAAFWLILGASWFFYFLEVLRQAEAD